MTIEEPIPEWWPSTAVKSELDLPEARRRVGRPDLGWAPRSHFEIDHPRHADLKIVFEPSGHARRSGAQGSCDLRRSGRRAGWLWPKPIVSWWRAEMRDEDLDQGSAVLRWTTAGGTNGPSP